jgi:hypothetical protein
MGIIVVLDQERNPLPPCEADSVIPKRKSVLQKSAECAVSGGSYVFRLSGSACPKQPCFAPSASRAAPAPPTIFAVSATKPNMIRNSDHTPTVSVDVFKPLKVLDFFHGLSEATGIHMQPEFSSPVSVH